MAHISPSLLPPFKSVGPLRPATEPDLVGNLREVRLPAQWDSRGSHFPFNSN